MSEHINLNNDWGYSKNFTEDMIKDSFDESIMERVRLPHANVTTPFHYFDDRICQFVSCYRKHIEIKEEWRGKHILLNFEGVGHVAEVFFNEQPVTVHYGGYTAFTIDLAQYVRFIGCAGESLPGGGLEHKSAPDNVLTVVVDSRETRNLPPFGNVIDYLTYGGIYREVSLDIKEKLFIEDVFVITKNREDKQQSGDPRFGAMELELRITLQGSSEGNPFIRYSVLKCSSGNAEIYNKEEASANTTDQDQNSSSALLSGNKAVNSNLINITAGVDDAELWDIDHPVLYKLQLELWKDEEGKERLLDEKNIRFGFRTCEFKKDGFYLNNKKIKLVGLNRHQSFPYVGYAMPKRLQQRDAQILKNELMVNAVRTSHYPQSKHFIDSCDELGLLVFTEIPGWQHIGDEQWKEIACSHVREMVTQYRSHPSVVLWGVRINESQDDDEFYARTNRIAHELDHSRQTGGVRYLKKSRLLEDVYTYNDFYHNGTTNGLLRKKDVTPEANAPYLVTEFNGHMFPAKAFDNEEHRLEHALRHAKVLDALYEHEDIAGGFGWCMFDYNTNKDFGSGDKICYHGVTDMFRNPKPAAYVYASQINLSTVCEVSSSMDIGEHPSGDIGEVYVFTNADSVKLYKNDRLVKEFHPARIKYAHLPHPPVVIDDFVGDLMEKQEHFSHKTAERLKEVLFAVSRYGQNNLPFKYKLKMAFLMLKERLSMSEGVRLYMTYIGNWGGNVTSYRFETIRDHQIVRVIDKKPVSRPRLLAVPDSLILKEEETYDVAGVRITAVDENGNRLYYYQEPVRFLVSGAIELIGPSIISLKGGAAGTYVKTTGVEGEGILRILQEELGELTLKFTVIQS